ncbi:A-kinase-interacting protein 1 isoform X3 [Pleurodeles waltl]|uniref:A-kinase-interacting protein 1 isoform X3 n=1 Tax=Pleurodeles waltl TaxID=8319 RepID=UPI0037099616
MTSRGICMEQSLERSAKLSLDVLKRAKRRKVNWPDECNMQKFRAQDRGLYNNEDENIPLEEAEQYYHYKPFSECDKNEVNHVCRYHSRNLASTSQKPSSPSKQETFSIFPLSSTGGRSNSKDVVIEVTPGTYSVSARSHGLRHRTQLVNITPGQSVDVVFTT